MNSKPINTQRYKIDGCFCDPEMKFAFIHIYKNASISIRNALGMRGRYYKYEDVTDLTTLCVLRDPFRRVISMYLYLLRLEDNGRTNQHPIDLTVKTEFFRIQHKIEESFKSFVSAIDGRNFYDAVTYPQIDFIRDRGISPENIDVVMIQEHIYEDFDKFKLKYNLDSSITLPHDNVSDAHKTVILNKLIMRDVKLQTKIKNIYEEDFELYEQVCRRDE